jgi:hypothetical protein
LERWAGTRSRGILRSDSRTKTAAPSFNARVRVRVGSATAIVLDLVDIVATNGIAPTTGNRARWELVSRAARDE